ETTTKAPMRVGGDVKAPRKIRDVKPRYPAEALAARVSGAVIAEIRIRTDGSVGDVRIIQSVPMFDNAAIDAFLGWKFEPTLLNGEPVELLMTVTMDFRVDGAVQAVETALKKALFTMRAAIDRHYSERHRYPDSIESLVSDGYLERVPVDPITYRADTWLTVPPKGDPNSSTTPAGIADVHSGSDKTAPDGTTDSAWWRLRWILSGPLN